jgi:hypothetical protein
VLGTNDHFPSLLRGPRLFHDVALPDAKYSVWE